MRNRIPTYPGRVHLAPVEGQANVFDLTRADQPQDPGTPLNKGTLLSDDVEALIWGAAADRTVNDAFGKVSELYQHWWSILHDNSYSYYEEVKTPLTARVQFIFPLGAHELKYAKEISIDGSGNISLVNATTLQCEDSDNGVENFCSTLADAAPVYIYATTSEDQTVKQLLFIPSGATYTSTNDNYNAAYTIAGIYDGASGPYVYLNVTNVPSGLIASVVTSKLVEVTAGATTYVHSPDRNAYPDSGTVDGLTYKYLGVPFENARTGGKVEAGSYVGTGTYGSSNPNIISAPFKIEAFAVYGSSMNEGGLVWPRGTSYGQTHMNSNNVSDGVYITWDETTVSYYSSGTAIRQLNYSGQTYYYIIWG